MAHEKIHPTAIVAPQARIGPAVEIGPHSIVGPHVTLGEGCRLHHHVTVEGHTTLGEGCEVFPQAVLGMAPQDIKWRGEDTKLVIGRNTIIREMVTAHPGTANGGGITETGENNLFLIGVHIAHDCKIGNRCILANYVQLAGHVHVEDHVNMGGSTSVHHFVTIGKHAFVGGMTRCSADVPPFMVVVAARGNRTEARMVNGVGLQRSGYSHADIAALKVAYMKIFARRARLSGVGIAERVQLLLDGLQLNPHVRYLCEFLQRSFEHGRHGRYLESLRADPVRRSSWKLDSEHTLTVNVVGNGSVERTARDDAQNTNAVVELVAKADSGWSFSGWNGSLSDRENLVRVRLDSDKTLTATFVRSSTTF